MSVKKLTNAFQKLQATPCKPSLLMNGGHIQTILGHLLPSHHDWVKSKGELVEIPLADGDRLIARHLSVEKGSHVLYLFHGLGSNLSAGYMLRTAALASKLGFEVYLVNHRGCGEGKGLAKNPYHSGSAKDLGEVIAYGRARSPKKIHVAAGFSLSANALLLLASGKHGDSLPDIAIAANAPINLDRASLLLRKGLSKIYDYRFSIECRMDIAARAKLGLLDDKKYVFPWWSSLRDFDRIYTGPASGFGTRENYYASCSAAPFLQHIQIPTVLMTAQDDPFIDYRDYSDAKHSSQVIYHLEKYGGHLGYLTEKVTPLGNKRWLDYALFEYLSAIVD